MRVNLLVSNLIFISSQLFSLPVGLRYDYPSIKTNQLNHFVPYYYVNDDYVYFPHSGNVPSYNYQRSISNIEEKKETLRLIAPIITKK